MFIFRNTKFIFTDVNFDVIHFKIFWIITFVKLLNGKTEYFFVAYLFEYLYIFCWLFKLDSPFFFFQYPAQNFPEVFFSRRNERENVSRKSLVGVACHPQPGQLIHFRFFVRFSLYLNPINGEIRLKFASYTLLGCTRNEYCGSSFSAHIKGCLNVWGWRRLSIWIYTKMGLILSSFMW